MSKLKSRTFWLAIAWSAFVPLGIIAQWALGESAKLPLSELIVGATVVVGAFVGGQKLVDAKSAAPPQG